MIEPHPLRFSGQSVGSDGKPACFHCGDPCHDTDIALGEKLFCCNGCKTVYELLHEKELCDYYAIDQGVLDEPSTDVAFLVFILASAPTRDGATIKHYCGTTVIPERGDRVL